MRSARAIAQGDREYIYECQNCGRWCVERVCPRNDADEPGCGERRPSAFRRIRRWS